MKILLSNIVNIEGFIMCNSRMMMLSSRRAVL